MSTSTPAHKATWAVTGQEEHTEHDTSGKPHTMHTVHFQTGSGAKSSVTLHDDNFSAENVHAQITHKAGEIEKTAKLTHASTPEPPATS